MVCSGRGCSVAFKDVSFQTCTEVVLNCADVTLTNCMFTASEHCASVVAVLASGRDSNVNMHGGTITGAGIPQRVSAQDGAQLQATGASISYITTHGG